MSFVIFVLLMAVLCLVLLFSISSYIKVVPEPFVVKSNIEGKNYGHVYSVESLTSAKRVVIYYSEAVIVIESLIRVLKAM